MQSAEFETVTTVLPGKWVRTCLPEDTHVKDTILLLKSPPYSNTHTIVSASCIKQKETVAILKVSIRKFQAKKFKYSAYTLVQSSLQCNAGDSFWINFLFYFVSSIVELIATGVWRSATSGIDPINLHLT